MRRNQEPLSAKYPYLSAYSAYGSNPINIMDPTGYKPSGPDPNTPNVDGSPVWEEASNDSWDTYNSEEYWKLNDEKVYNKGSVISRKDYDKKNQILVNSVGSSDCKKIYDSKFSEIKSDYFEERAEALTLKTFGNNPYIYNHGVRLLNPYFKGHGLIDNNLEIAGYFSLAGSLTKYATSKATNFVLKNSINNSTSNRVFWSGGKEAEGYALSFAKSNNAVTLEMTLEGQLLSMIPKQIPYKLTKHLWEKASSKFANGASGEANVFIYWGNYRYDSIWNMLEKDILLNNKNIQYIFLHNK